MQSQATYKPHVQIALLNAQPDNAPDLNEIDQWPDNQLTAAIRTCDAHRSTLKGSALIGRDLTITQAHGALTERIRLLHIEMQRRAAKRNEGTYAKPEWIEQCSANTEVEQAREATRKIAADYERVCAERDALKAKLATYADKHFLQAFCESCQFILAESTFTRIKKKATELANSTLKRS